MRRFPAYQPAARRWGSLVANLAILWIIAVVVALNRPNLANFRFDLLWALLAVNLGGYLAGYTGGLVLRLPEPMRRALTLEIGMQNAGLGAVLALDLFKTTSSDEIAVAPAMYTFGCMLTGTMLATGWSFFPTATEKQSK
jgi:BASS family bile acid:Na+ symporter